MAENKEELLTECFKDSMTMENKRVVIGVAVAVGALGLVGGLGDLAYHLLAEEDKKSFT